MHWENIYSRKTSDELSWTQSDPNPSLKWIEEVLPNRDSSIIDIGGGNSILIDHLLKVKFIRPSVLDISRAALRQSQDRLAEKKYLVDWIECSVTNMDLNKTFSLWHDRAVFHFLINPSERIKYIENLRKHLAKNGKVIIATFSHHGPLQCSGLDVMRFDENSLSAELGSDFKLIRTLNQIHSTPWGSNQEFIYCMFEKL